MSAILGPHISAPLQYICPLCRSPDKLSVESIAEAKALLKVADKYNMPRLLQAVKVYLMPEMSQVEVNCSPWGVGSHHTYEMIVLNDTREIHAGLHAVDQSEFKMSFEHALKSGIVSSHEL